MGLDTRWLTVPLMCLLSLAVGDVSLWVVALVLVASFKLNIKF